MKEQGRYLKHLSRLYAFTFPRATSLLAMAGMGAVGLAVGLSATLASTIAPPPVALSALGAVAATTFAGGTLFNGARRQQTSAIPTTASASDSQTFRKAA